MVAPGNHCGGDLPMEAPCRSLPCRVIAVRRLRMNDMASDLPSCACLRAGEPFIGKLRFSYGLTISAETVGVRAKAHKHEHHETAIHVLSGEVAMWYGARLQNRMVTRPVPFTCPDLV